MLLIRHGANLIDNKIMLIEIATIVCSNEKMYYIYLKNIFMRAIIGIYMCWFHKCLP